jgi:hypothetical protein
MNLVVFVVSLFSSDTKFSMKFKNMVMLHETKENM